MEISFVRRRVRSGDDAHITHGKKTRRKRVEQVRKLKHRLDDMMYTHNDCVRTARMCAAARFVYAFAHVQSNFSTRQREAR